MRCYRALPYVMALLTASVAHLWAISAGDLAARSDAIVVGTVDSRFESQTMVVFDINVRRTIGGGPVGPVIHISHSWSGGMVGPPQTIDYKVNGVWVLVRRPAGGWDVLQCRGGGLFGSLFYPASLDAPEGPYAYRAAAERSDSFIFEVAAGLELTKQEPASLLGLVNATASSSALSVFRSYVASGDAAFRAIGLAGLLEIGDPGALARIAPIMPSLSDEPNRFYVVSGLRDYWRDTTPASTGQLIALVDAPSTSEEMRQAAIRSLMMTHTAESLAFFGHLLFSSDLTAQMQAVVAISAFVNGCSVQTPATVASLSHLKCSGTTSYKSPATVANFAFGVGSAAEEAQEATLVAYWRGWWNDHPELH